MTISRSALKIEWILIHISSDHVYEVETHRIKVIMKSGVRGEDNWTGSVHLHDLCLLQLRCSWGLVSMCITEQLTQHLVQWWQTLICNNYTILACNLQQLASSGKESVLHFACVLQQSASENVQQSGIKHQFLQQLEKYCNNYLLGITQYPPNSDRILFMLMIT